MSVVNVSARNPETNRKRMQLASAERESEHFAITKPVIGDEWAAERVVTHKGTGYAALWLLIQPEDVDAVLEILERAGDDWNFTSYSTVKGTPQWKRCREAARAAAAYLDEQGVPA